MYMSQAFAGINAKSSSCSGTHTEGQFVGLMQLGDAK